MKQYLYFAVNNMSGMHMLRMKSGVHCHTLFQDYLIRYTIKKMQCKPYFQLGLHFFIVKER